MDEMEVRKLSEQMGLFMNGSELCCSNRFFFMCVVRLAASFAYLIVVFIYFLCGGLWNCIYELSKSD